MCGLRSSALLEAKVRRDRGGGRCGLRGWSQVLTVPHELRRRSRFEEAVVGSGLRRRRRWCSAELSPNREREYDDVSKCNFGNCALTHCQYL
ncbi:hypothetical protein M6B38_236740 [Iris pallida]|uniref:Uncharacterized protein n=1 Tax=Iris pallida TaxID=29817 RepID=A0AAX6DNG0_IRIPA|nr:hypothetical protein M6B38_236735 [Iris pallida]KAJ6793373.1 hypothetical protein M6B38_236740 [Iris pallida]